MSNINSYPNPNPENTTDTLESLYAEMHRTERASDDNRALYEPYQRPGVPEQLTIEDQQTEVPAEYVPADAPDGATSVPNRNPKSDPDVVNSQKLPTARGALKRAVELKNPSQEQAKTEATAPQGATIGWYKRNR